jgi:hypothetical protein
MRFLVGSVAACLLAGPAAAQTWNDEASRALAARGIARRAEDAARGLRDFRARAHGFVFFLAQLGAEGLEEPPRLVKSDQLELEVYWQATGRSKQRIIGWRDRAELPTDIRYHRDHLGIVMSGFADRIRLGEGDEVRDVPHPLAPDGPTLYDYALVDSIRIELPGRTVRALELAFRPRDFGAPRIVGSLFLDADGGDLVRMRFSFTRAAYLDESLEDIAVVLENGLWDGRYWLPRQQEIEIRRRTTWLDVPARGIIRGRWDVDGYEFDLGLPAATFLGPEIVAGAGARDSFPWRETLDDALAAELGPRLALRMDDVREVARGIAGPRSISGLRTHGLSIESASQAFHVNRVEGLSLGLGYAVRPAAGPFRARAWGGYGFSGRRVTGGVAMTYQTAGLRLGASARREIRDLADEPSVSGVVNTFLSQELGLDFGDYVRLDRAGVEVAARAWSMRVEFVATDSLTVAAEPLTGTYRPNPALGSGDWWTGTVAIGGRTGGIVGGAARGSVEVEGGLQRDRGYTRLRATAEATVPVGPGRLGLGGAAGWSTDDLPPHRAFVLGGRGSLVGEPYRAYGGRAVGHARLSWSVPLPAPAIPLGRYASTGRQLELAPYVAAGWAGRPIAGLPWEATDGIRPVLGVTVQALHRLLLIELGWGLRDGGVGLTVDIRRDLWPLL